MKYDNEEDSLEFINRLLERLHQAGHDHQCSQNIHLVYVASGAQHVETQIAYQQPLPDPPQREEPLPNPPQREEPLPDPPQKGRENELPEVLATEEAMALWRKVQEAGWIDFQYLPLISRTQAALLADAMAERLGIKEKWKVFEELWHRNYMRNDYNVAFSRKRSYDFMDELKAVLG